MKLCLVNDELSVRLSTKIHNCELEFSNWSRAVYICQDAPKTKSEFSSDKRRVATYFKNFIFYTSFSSFQIFEPIYGSNGGVFCRRSGICFSSFT